MPAKPELAAEEVGVASEPAERGVEVTTSTRRVMGLLVRVELKKTGWGKRERC